MIKIYFKDGYKAKSLKELLTLLYPGTYVKMTFLDPECTEYQCHGSARRSFEDLLAISNTYFETSEKELMKVLLDLNFNFYKCEEIKKIVFHFVDGYPKIKDFDETYIENSDNKIVDEDNYCEGTYLPSRLQEIINEVKNE